MGNTCKPMAVSFQCMTKFTTNKKKKKDKKKRMKIVAKMVGVSLTIQMITSNLNDFNTSIKRQRMSEEI